MKALILGGALLLAAATTFAGTRHEDMRMMKDCPMQIEGIEIAATDIPAGIAVTFTTQSGDPAELRRRVRHMSDIYTAPAASTRPMMNGMMTQQKLIPATAVSEEIPSGVRVSLVAKDPVQLAELQAQVRQHVEKMKTGDCSGMQGMMKGMVGEKQEPGTNPEPHQHQ